jgi:hypothetical protein
MSTCDRTDLNDADHDVHDARTRERSPRHPVGSSWIAWLIVLACLAGVAGPYAQEGHPLVGTWRGEWGPNAKQRHDLTFVMEYDGKAVTGQINPGFESMKLHTVALDPSTWTVRFQTETKDASGKVVPVVIQAKFEDVTNRHRSLVGTWTEGATKGDFKITLD